MSAKPFASQADLQEKKTSFIKLSDNAYAYTAEGDPNSGVIIGDDAVMVIDTTATPVMAQALIKHIREITDLPIKYVTLRITTRCACWVLLPISTKVRSK